MVDCYGSYSYLKLSEAKEMKNTKSVSVTEPRLAKTDRKKFHRFCQDYALADIRHPDIYGFGPAGLIEMTIRHTYMPLIDRMNAMSSAI